MKFKDYRKTTFKICQRFCKDQSDKNLYQLKCVLTKWSRDSCQLEDYGYTGNVFDNIAYCSDRMNSGRAKAILRLLEENGYL